MVRETVFFDFFSPYSPDFNPIEGLSSNENSEMLVELNGVELINDTYLKRLKKYAYDIDKASVKCGDPSIVITATSGKKSMCVKGGQYPKSSNPYIAYMPLYSWEKSKKGIYIKVINKQSGLN